MFRSAIGSATQDGRADASEGRDIDDEPIAPGAHVWQYGANEVIRSCYVDLHDEVPIFRVKLRKASFDYINPSIVDQNIHWAIFIADPSDHVLDLGAVGYIGGVGAYGARSADSSARFFEDGSAAAIDDNLCSGVGKGFSGSLTDTCSANSPSRPLPPWSCSGWSA